MKEEEKKKYVVIGNGWSFVGTAGEIVKRLARPLSSVLARVNDGKKIIYQGEACYIDLLYEE